MTFSLVLVLLYIYSVFPSILGKCGYPDYPNSCPSPTRDNDPVLNISDALDCRNYHHPTIFAKSNTLIPLQCCFDGYSEILWRYSKSPKGPFAEDSSCRTKFDNTTQFVLQVDKSNDGFYQCTAIGADGQNVSFVQQLVVVKMNNPVSSPKFDKECRRPKPLIISEREVGTRECGLQVPVKKDTNVSLDVFADEQPVFRCVYQPFCDRLISGAETRSGNVSDDFCVRLGQNGGRLRIGMWVRDAGSPITLEFIVESGPTMNVSVVAEMNNTRDVWKFQVKPRTSINTLIWALVSSALVVVCFVAAVVSIWTFGLNLRLVYRKLKYSDLTKLPCQVVIISCPDDSQSLQIGDELTTYLKNRPDSRYHVWTPMAGDSEATMVGRVGADPSYVNLVILETKAIQNEFFAGQMNSLLQRESCQRIYLLLESFSWMEKNLSNGEGSKDEIMKSEIVRDETDNQNLLQGIKADAKFVDCVRWRRRISWWNRWQVKTCLNLAHLAAAARTHENPSVRV